MDRSTQSRVLQVVLIVIGVALLALGIVYFTVAAGKLPSFLGHISHSSAHRTKRAFAGVVVGGICLLAALAAAMPRRAPKT